MHEAAERFCNGCGGPGRVLVEGEPLLSFCDATCAFGYGVKRRGSVQSARVAELERMVATRDRRIDALQTVIADQVVSELQKLREQKERQENGK